MPETPTAVSEDTALGALGEEVAAIVEEADKTPQPKPSWLICPLRSACRRNWTDYQGLNPKCPLGKLILDNKLTQEALDLIGDIVWASKNGGAEFFDSDQGELPQKPII